MSAFRTTAFMLISVFPALSYGAELGKCAERKTLLSELQKEGQHILVNAVEPVGLKQFRSMIVTSTSDGSTGYVIKDLGKNRSCITSRLSDVQIGQGRARADNTADLSRNACDDASKDAPIFCARMKTALSRIKKLDLKRLVETGPVESLSVKPRARSISRAKRERWSSGQFAFCTTNDNILRLCATARAFAPNEDSQTSAAVK